MLYKQKDWKLMLAKNEVKVHLEIFLFYYAYCAPSQNQNWSD